MKMRLVLVMLLVFVTACGKQSAPPAKQAEQVKKTEKTESSSNLRACRKSEIAGNWSMVRLTHSIPPRAGDPDFFPNQLWMFSEAGKVEVIKVSTQLTPEMIDGFIKSYADDAKKTCQYEVVEDKAMLVYRDPKAPAPLYFACLVATKDYLWGQNNSWEAKAGDLFIEAWNLQTKQMIISHQLRKLVPGSAAAVKQPAQAPAKVK